MTFYFKLDSVLFPTTMMASILLKLPVFIRQDFDNRGEEVRHVLEIVTTEKEAYKLGQITALLTRDLLALSKRYGMPLSQENWPGEEDCTNNTANEQEED